MKILHCLAQLPKNTGSGVYFSMLVKGLEKSGHKNAVLYGIQEPFIVDFSDKIKKYEVKFNSEKLDFNIVGMSDEMPYPSTKYSEMNEVMYSKWIEAFKEKLLIIKDEFEPDIIITHHIFILSGIVKEVFDSTKIFGISHGTDIRQVKKNEWIKERYIKNINKFTHYFALSKKDMKDLKEVFDIPENKITVIGGGFNEKYFYEEDKCNIKETIKIFYAGKLSYAKGVFELARTLRKLNQRYKNIELILVGNIDKEKEFELRRRSADANNLHILAAKSQEEMASLMRKSDIFVLPSYYEGLGLVVLEALACGLRIVSTEIEGLMHILGERINESDVIEYVKLPRLYDVDKPFQEDIEVFEDNLYLAISKQIDRIKRKEKITNEIKKDIKKYTWANIVNRIEEIIKVYNI